MGCSRLYYMAIDGRKDLVFLERIERNKISSETI